MRRKFIFVYAIVGLMVVLIVGLGWQSTAAAGSGSGSGYGGSGSGYGGSGGNHGRYGPHAPMITTSSSVTFPGGSLSVSGVNFKPGESITLTLLGPPVVLATTSSNATGSFSVGVTIPTGTQPGVHTIVATGASGDSASTAIVVREKTSPPVITSGPSATATVGQFFSFQVTATGYPPPRFSEAGALPAGVSFSSAGNLSGTPRFRSAGTYQFTILARNSAGSTSQTFTLTVVQLSRAPSITSRPNATAVVGRYFSFRVIATGYPAPSFTEVGALPAGVSFTSAGQLSGTPRSGSAGTYPLTITATNSAGSASQTFSLTVIRPTP